MTLPDIVQRARLLGLRPVADNELELVLADCPSCDAGAADPLGMFRPLRIVPRGRGLTFYCSACEREGEFRGG